MRATIRLLRDRIATTGTAGRLRRIEEPNLLILTYHRVLPRTHDEWRREQPGMLVSPETLGMHLAELQIHFELVHLDDWVDARSAGRQLPRLACAVTLDDGWRDNYDFAFPVLRQNDVPATIFLVADLVGTRYAFWPNRLARALSGLRDRKDLEAWPQSLRQRLLEAGVTSAPVSAARINVAIERCKVLPDAELHSLLDMVASTMSEEGEPRDLLDWQEIRGMQSSGLVRFGSHTRRHTRLRDGTDRNLLDDEVRGSADALQRELGQRPMLFCYPNGDYGSEALQAVTSHYAAAVTTRTGWNYPTTPLHQLRRVSVHEDVASNRAGLLYRIMAARD